MNLLLQRPCMVSVSMGQVVVWDLLPGESSNTHIQVTRRKRNNGEMHRSKTSLFFGREKGLYHYSHP